MTPAQLAIDDTVQFLTDALRGRRRVLEVGCGRGQVARRLGAAGFSVTALDVSLPDPSPAPNVRFVERDFLQLDPASLFEPADALRRDGAPFDAVVFTASLHHIAPLAAAIDTAHRLLGHGGIIVADEFDRGAPSPATLRWYYDLQDVLAAVGLFPHDRVDAPDPDLDARWRAAHTHEPPLHTGAQMCDTIVARFHLLDAHGAPYLYRYLTRHLPDDARGIALAQHIQAAEQRGIADRALSAVGLRITAVRG